MSKPHTERLPDGVPVVVSHVADSSRCYPGETITLYTQIKGPAPLPGFTLRIVLPEGLVLETYRVLKGPNQVPRITFGAGESSIIWRVARAGQASDRAHYEYAVRATVAPTQDDRLLESRAIVSVEEEGSEAPHVTATAGMAVLAQGTYLKYLPAIYQEDELMGRFLMLFESFWAPIDRQIRDLSLYLDPRLAPPEFLPWLASWLDLVLDERWPEEKRRRLLCSAAPLYRKRGTRSGLEEYLEIYTGVRPKIVEHRAHNLRLGSEARLGAGIALGRGNMPHTFTVILSLPASAVLALSGSREPDYQEAERRFARQVEAIIEAEKPAHTTFTLRIQLLDDRGAPMGEIGGRSQHASAVED